MINYLIHPKTRTKMDRNKQKTATRPQPQAGGGRTFVGTEDTIRLDTEGAGPADPAAGGDGGDAVAGLVHADVAAVAEHHLVTVLALRLERGGGG